MAGVQGRIALVLEPHSRRVNEGFSEACVLAEVSLLTDKICVASGRRVAMATGVVDRSFKRGQVQKQVLVVVTSGGFPSQCSPKGDNYICTVLSAFFQMHLDPFEEIKMAEDTVICPETWL
ncbi:hypothetical protein Tco_0731936 [Tanacetum coccineum]